MPLEHYNYENYLIALVVLSKMENDEFGAIYTGGKSETSEHQIMFEFSV